MLYAKFSVTPINSVLDKHSRTWKIHMFFVWICLRLYIVILAFLVVIFKILLATFMIHHLSPRLYKSGRVSSYNLELKKLRAFESEYNFDLSYADGIMHNAVGVL